MSDNLQYWQHILGLDDWRIALVENCRPEDMSESGVAGCVDYNEVCKAARVELIDPKYYGERIIPLNLEKTLVHELLHLKLCLIADTNSEMQTRYVHQIIDDLARAFVEAKEGSVVRRKNEETEDERIN